MTLPEFQAARGLTITALASLLGFPVSTTHGWVMRKKKPDVKFLDRIASATGGEVSPADLRPDLAAMFAAKASREVLRPVEIARSVEKCVQDD